MNFEAHFFGMGVFLVGLTFLHLGFPKYLDWRNELPRLSLLNRQIMQVHTFFIAFVVLLIGVLCLSSSELLATTVLGRRICLGLGVFWLARLLIQFFGYSADLWRGKTFETTVHIVFTAFWIYLTTVFFLAGLSG